MVWIRNIDQDKEVGVSFFFWFGMSLSYLTGSVKTSGIALKLEGPTTYRFWPKLGT